MRWSTISFHTIYVVLYALPAPYHFIYNQEWLACCYAVNPFIPELDFCSRPPCSIVYRGDNPAILVLRRGRMSDNINSPLIEAGT